MWLVQFSSAITLYNQLALQNDKLKQKSSQLQVQGQNWSSVL